MRLKLSQKGLHGWQKAYTFASCFSWYRFKVNWIGCRETINFFVYTCIPVLVNMDDERIVGGCVKIVTI